MEHWEVGTKKDFKLDFDKLVTVLIISAFSEDSKKEIIGAPRNVRGSQKRNHRDPYTGIRKREQ